LRSFKTLAECEAYEKQHQAEMETRAKAQHKTLREPSGAACNRYKVAAGAAAPAGGKAPAQQGPAGRGAVQVAPGRGGGGVARLGRAWGGPLTAAATSRARSGSPPPPRPAARSAPASDCARAASRRIPGSPSPMRLADC